MLVHFHAVRLGNGTLGGPGEETSVHVACHGVVVVICIDYVTLSARCQADRV